MLVGNLEYDEGISNSFVVEVYWEKENGEKGKRKKVLKGNKGRFWRNVVRGY